jgi:hypothetical protein
MRISEYNVVTFFNFAPRMRDDALTNGSLIETRGPRIDVRELRRSDSICGSFATSNNLPLLLVVALIVPVVVVAIGAAAVAAVAVDSVCGNDIVALIVANTSVSTLDALATMS